MKDIQKLKALAEAATKGDWRYGPGDGDDENPIVFVDLPQASGVAISILFEGDWATDADAKFVSKANPAAVLELIEEIERLQAAKSTLDRLGYTDNGGQLWKPPIGRKPDFDLVDQLKAENESLRKQIADSSPFKNASRSGPDLKCLACGGYHYGIAGLPCPNMGAIACSASSQEPKP